MVMGGLAKDAASIRPDQPCSVVTHGRGSAVWLAGVTTTASTGCLRPGIAMTSPTCSFPSSVTVSC